MNSNNNEHGANFPGKNKTEKPKIVIYHLVESLLIVSNKYDFFVMVLGMEDFKSSVSDKILSSW